MTKKISTEKYQKYILPEVLQPIGDSSRLIKILNWIPEIYSKPSQEQISVYNQYLKLAYKSSDFERNILPHIQLMNQCKEWKSPNELCDGERYTGIDRSSLLNEYQRELLSFYLDDCLEPDSCVSTEDSINTAPNNIDTSDNAQKLEQYFRPWLPYVMSEAIGCFLCVIAGNNQESEKLAQSYLQKRKFDDVKERLLWGTTIRKREFQISIQSNNEKKISAINLLKEQINVEKLLQKFPEHLFIGELSSRTTKLTLVSIKPTRSISHELENILKESIKIFNKTITQTNNEPFEEIWEDITTSKQLDIQVAKRLILEQCSLLSRRLGVENYQVKDILKQLDDNDHQRVSLKSRSPNIDRKNQKIQDNEEEKEKIILKLEQLIEEDINTQQDIIAAVRQSIGQGQSGYQSTNIPFELFQNADDCLAEFSKMIGDLPTERLHYILAWNADSLTVMHWGRPINLFIHPDTRDRDFRNEGFDRDLVKMLSFNISDKSEGVTGKFGLGFKTVHLISKEPKIISGDLRFAIQAGLLPIALPRRDREEEDLKLIDSLRDRLQNEQPSSDITDGTLINLEIDPETNTNLSKIVGEFENKVGLLVVFAKFIKTCHLYKESSSREKITWEPEEILGISGIEIAKVKIREAESNYGNWIDCNLFCFRIRDASVALTIPNNFADRESPLSKLPTFWVTAPTKEELGFRFVINAMFDITTGRTSLDRNSENNPQLAKKIGRGLSKKLCQLFERANGNWDALREYLKIEQGDEYSFWEYLWNVLVLDWLRKSNEAVVLAALQGKDCGMGYLSSHHEALPNGLYGESYRQLICIQNISYVVRGILAQKKYFERVATWEKFQQNCQPTSVVRHNVWQDVMDSIGRDDLNNITPQELEFADALKWELGNKQVTPADAARLGEIVTKGFLEDLDRRYSEEFPAIKTVLNNVCFQSEDDKNYIESSKLLVEKKNNNEKGEEELLAAFAPKDRLLHRDYTAKNLEFFYACRDPIKTISVKELKNWAIAADTESKKQAVRRYLLRGEKKQELINVLGDISGTWMEHYEGMEKILKVGSQQEKMKRAEQGEIFWNEIDINSQLFDYEADLDWLDTDNSNTNLNETFLSIYEWWEVNHANELKKYNQNLYPLEFKELKQRLQERDRSAWLMLFFLGKTHTMGRTRHRQHRDFVNFCLSQDWWSIFSTPDPRSLPDRWMSVLDDYMEQPLESTTWNYWIEKFPSIYRIASYLNAYIESFLAIDSYTHPFDLKHITKPRSNPIFQGGGPDAPPLQLGIGANFVVRELVRLEILESKPHILPHCYIPRANVRRLLTYLGCEGLSSPNYSHSEPIYQFLCDRFQELELPMPPTFRHAFDIPFELCVKNCPAIKDISLETINIEGDNEFDEEGEY